MSDNQVIPAAAVEAAGDVLVYHQRRDIKGCACGWSELGRSHAAHQARIALDVAAPYIVAQALRDAVDAFPLETITAPDTAVVWLMRRAEDMSPRG